ncbi:ABC transporter ATP-binding protein [Reichenbachiella sp. MALMAid0571]|uniref:ABC transporter ATP-binding protein n=1 Tax=Reichenbachiella sp. MALMAid0571 TaxID=3143939 RepID=UPI0032DE9D40
MKGTELYGRIFSPTLSLAFFTIDQTFAKDEKTNVLCVYLKYMGSVINVRGVSKTYDTQVNAIRDISFDVNEGEVISILGESGSGKSTLLRLIAGLEDADKGSILIDDQIIKGPADNLVPGYDFVSLVFQNFQLQRFKTVRDNIASEIYFLSAEERTERVDQLLELCRLVDKSENFPHELSGGQQQRVAIAIALAKDPEVVLMDEPFSSLDSRLKAIIRQEMIDILREERVTVIMVSHDHADALSVADRIMVMRKGEMVQVATPEELYHFPKSEYAADFLGPINYLSLNGSSGAIGIRPEKLKIVKSGKYQGIVEKTTFQGMHYHTYIQSDISNNSILIYSEENRKKGSKVEFEVI